MTKKIKTSTAPPHKEWAEFGDYSASSHHELLKRSTKKKPFVIQTLNIIITF